MLDRDDAKLAGFVFKGQLADAAAEALTRPGGAGGELTYEDIARRVSLSDLDPDAVSDAEKMAAVYVVIASFENMVRDLISARLLEEKGANWWEDCVPKDVKRRAERVMGEEERIRWHKARGLSPIYYTELKDLTSVIQVNWESFEDLFPDIDWVRHIIRTIERSRNVIMHSGQLSLEDIERVGVTIRDWIRQVGT